MEKEMTLGDLREIINNSKANDDMKVFIKMNGYFKPMSALNLSDLNGLSIVIE